MLRFLAQMLCPAQQMLPFHRQMLGELHYTCTIGMKDGKWRIGKEAFTKRWSHHYERAECNERPPATCRWSRTAYRLLKDGPPLPVKGNPCGFAPQPRWSGGLFMSGPDILNRGAGS